mmetsp:Transcript_25650/g.96569  ORF Transcript_25650/g.96569 Transcript_25650/m.96569 type:complete len:383 (+) Transcript_25650:277-1425(+)
MHAAGPRASRHHSADPHWPRPAAAAAAAPSSRSVPALSETPPIATEPMRLLGARSEPASPVLDPSSSVTASLTCWANGASAGLGAAAASSARLLLSIDCAQACAAWAGRWPSAPCQASTHAASATTTAAARCRSVSRAHRLLHPSSVATRRPFAGRAGGTTASRARSEARQVEPAEPLSEGLRSGITRGAEGSACSSSAGGRLGSTTLGGDAASPATRREADALRPMPRAASSLERSTGVSTAATSRLRARDAHSAGSRSPSPRPATARHGSGWGALRARSGVPASGSPAAAFCGPGWSARNRGPAQMHIGGARSAAAAEAGAAPGREMGTLSRASAAWGAAGTAAGAAGSRNVTAMLTVASQLPAAGTAGSGCLAARVASS